MTSTSNNNKTSSNCSMAWRPLLVWCAILGVSLCITESTSFCIPQATLATSARTTTTTTASQLHLSATPPNSENENDDEENLILDNSALQQQMNSLKSKYPTSEADYLAAARARAAARTESKQRQATDDDWQQLAAQKKREMGTAMDDWEASAAEAGNADSQILFMSGMPEDGDDDAVDPEPKLLL